MFEVNLVSLVCAGFALIPAMWVLYGFSSVITKVILIFSPVVPWGTHSYWDVISTVSTKLYLDIQSFGNNMRVMRNRGVTVFLKSVIIHILIVIVKFQLAIEFLITHFVFYTLNGKRFYGLMLALVIGACFGGLPIECLFIGFLGYTIPLGCALTLYLIAQFEVGRALLKSLLGFELFELYIGSNPGGKVWFSAGSQALAAAGGTTLLAGGLAAVETVATNFQVNTYVNACKDGSVPVNPTHVKEIIDKGVIKSLVTDTLKAYVNISK